MQKSEENLLRIIFKSVSQGKSKVSKEATGEKWSMRGPQQETKEPTGKVERWTEHTGKKQVKKGKKGEIR